MRARKVAKLNLGGPVLLLRVGVEGVLGVLLPLGLVTQNIKST